MYELKDGEWYYIYTDGEKLFITNDPPFKSCVGESIWRPPNGETVDWLDVERELCS